MNGYLFLSFFTQIHVFYKILCNYIFFQFNKNINNKLFILYFINTLIFIKYFFMNILNCGCDQTNKNIGIA